MLDMKKLIDKNSFVSIVSINIVLDNSYINGENVDASP